MAGENFTITVKEEILDFLAEKFQEFAPDYHFFRTPVYFANKQQFCKFIKAAEPYNENYVIKYANVVFGRFTDSKKAGWDHSPSTAPSWRIQMFHSFVEYRLNDDETAPLTNSHDTLVNDMITLRNGFLIDRDIIDQPNKLVAQPLEMMGDMMIANESPFIKDEIGDWINFRFTVEVV
jgi:hypothetical protein